MEPLNLAVAGGHGGPRQVLVGQVVLPFTPNLYWAALLL